MPSPARDGSYDFNDVIYRLIDERTKYLRHYDAKVLVNIDPIDPTGGRVLVEIPDLGWDVTTEAWAEPRQARAMSIPKIGDFVECYFIGADPDRLVYMGSVHELENTVDYSGDPLTSILFESNLLKNAIKHDDKLGKFSIKSLFFELGLATDPMVKGAVLLTFLTTLVTELNAFVTAFNTHTHVSVTSLGAPTVPVAPAVPTTPPTPAINSLKNKLD